MSSRSVHTEPRGPSELIEGQAAFHVQVESEATVFTVFSARISDFYICFIVPIF